MLISLLISITLYILAFIITLLGNIPSFPVTLTQSAILYCNQVVNGGSRFLFFVIRPQTFYIAIDVLFFLYAWVPLVQFIKFVLRMIPFLGIGGD